MAYPISFHTQVFASITQKRQSFWPPCTCQLLQESSRTAMHQWPPSTWLPQSLLLSTARPSVAAVTDANDFQSTVPGNHIFNRSPLVWSLMGHLKNFPLRSHGQGCHQSFLVHPPYVFGFTNLIWQPPCHRTKLTTRCRWWSVDSSTPFFPLISKS